MRDEFVDTCGLCDAPLRMGQRCACGDNWRAAQPAPAQSAIITPDVPPLDIHSAAARIWQALQGVDLRKQDPVPVIAQALADAAIQHVGAPAQPASAEQQPVANRGTPGLQDVRVERTIIDRYPEINPSNYDHEAVCAPNSWGFDVVMNARPIEDAPPAQPAPCPHIRSSGTGGWATNWCELNGPPAAQPSDAELERRTGEPHVDGWPLYSGLPPAAKPAPRDAVTDEMVEAAWEVLYGDTLNAEDGKRVRAALVAAMGVRDE